MAARGNAHKYKRGGGVRKSCKKGGARTDAQKRAAKGRRK